MLMFSVSTIHIVMIRKKYDFKIVQIEAAL